MMRCQQAESHTFWIALLAVVIGLPHCVVGAEPTELPAFGNIRLAVEQLLAQEKRARTSNILTRGDAEPLFAEFERLGWTASEKQQLLSRLLNDGDALVTLLRGPAGAKLISQVSNEALVYDRLDRLMREAGGQRMLTDLVKLPDAARYVRSQRARAVPGLVDFLPKGPSGKTRQVRDYDKPTGKIYTVPQFMEELERSYERDRQRMENPVAS